MKTVYLHIGTHKTGSTSIQKFLAAADEALKEQGILYPKTGRPRENWSPYGHHKLRWAVAGEWKQKDKRIWEELRQEVCQHPGDRAIVSAEGFETCTTQEIRRLVNQLSPFSIRVILYLRPPAQFLRAAYAQRVKMEKYHASFSQCVDDMISRCDYLGLVSRWEQFEEIESIHIRLFDKVKNEPGLEASFADATGIGFSRVRSFVGPPANTSPPNSVIQTVRWINKIEKAGPTFRPFQELIDRMRGNVLGRRWPGRWISYTANLVSCNSFVTYRIKKSMRGKILLRHKEFLSTYLENKDYKYLNL
ncbi:hypothetical protein [Salinibacter sp.]|uniref:hypothetical protein n=1 Tax=Salinibacter sp. TaxID=2065818 RepID=UPI0021E7DD49|nr:hypothetical protein [Salinibacter sp.]